MLFTRGPVRFLSFDSISFARPVPIGSVLRLKSYILHTASTKEFPALIVRPSLLHRTPQLRTDPLLLQHVGVKANVVDIRTGMEQMTNDFRFTWCTDHNISLTRKVVPKTYKGTYGERLCFLEGWRWPLRGSVSKIN